MMVNGPNSGHSTYIWIQLSLLTACVTLDKVPDIHDYFFILKPT